MKSLPLLRLVILFTGLVSLRAFAADGEARFSEKELAQGYVDTVVLAKPRAEKRATVDAAEAGEGRRMRHKFERIGDLRVLEVKSGETVGQAIASLRATGRYDYVEPDHLRYALITPNDGRFGEQWSLNNTGSNGPGVPTAGADIRAVSGWDTLYNAAGIVVAVIDSGAMLTHEDLAANLWTTSGGNHGASFIGGSGAQTSTDPTDTEVGHGSHVSGIIGAVGNNNRGIAGVAWSVQLMELRFLHGSTGAGTSSDGIAAINYAIANGAKIMNMSFGADTFVQAEYDAINSARAAGIIVVASAGNSSENVDLGTSYPAGYALDNVVTVAATTDTDALASFSSYGTGSVDLAAPGDTILSCWIDGGYRTESGTSMSAPHVSGALALIKARFPNETYRQTINRLLRAVTPVAGLAGKVQTGGRLNLNAALTGTDTRPFNDDFAARANLGSAANIRLRTSSAGSSSALEAGEPAHAGVACTNSLWWSWTAPSTTAVTFSTTGTSYDTVIAVYTGSALNSLASIGSNDDDTAHGKTTSTVTVNVTQGTTYQIAVACKSGTPGLTLLQIGAIPPNDNFANAQLLTGNSVQVTGSTINATSESSETFGVSNPAGHSVWYKWVAPASAHYALYAYSPTVDMTAAVYANGSFAAGNRIASNDDAATQILTGTYQGAVNSNSLVPFNATAGATYYFQIDTTTVNPIGGDFTLTVTDAAWQFGAYGGVISSPAVGSDGTIYIAAGTPLTDQTLDNGNYPENNLYALSSSGSMKWKFTAPQPFDLSSPALGNDGNIYIGCDTKLYAVDAGTGAQKWNYTTSSVIDSSPALGSDGTVYVRDDTTLYAVSNTGSLKWTFTLGTSLSSTYGSPTVTADGTIYVGIAGGALFAVNADGTQRWKFIANGDVYTAAAIDFSNTIYFATLNGSVYALNADGTKKWQHDYPGVSITSSPILAADGTLYFGAYDHKLPALDPATGNEKWTYLMSGEVRAATPVVGADGTVYMPDYDGFVYAINSSGALVRTYATAMQLLRSSPIISGGNLIFGGADGLVYAFNLGAGNSAPATSAWPSFQNGTSHPGRLIAPSTVNITTQPQGEVVPVGGMIRLTVAATGSGPVYYQWLKNGAEIIGAVNATYVNSNAQASDSGLYSVRVTVGNTSVTSNAVSVIVGSSIPTGGRLINLSVRTNAGTGDSSLIVGFVVGGSNTAGVTPYLVRGVGPTLLDYGVSGALLDPRIDLTQNVNGTTTAVDSNDNWSGSGQVTSVGNMVGAFALHSSTSLDAATVETLGGGVYSVKVSGVNNTTGIALAEIYDAAGTAFTSATPRLVNVSARAQVGTGDSVLIAGFVVGGTAPVKVLIRAVGPTLSNYGVGGVLADPTIELSQTVNGTASIVATNDNWGGNASIAAAASTVGAFALPSATSKDAALLVTLQPGVYSAKCSGVGNTSGVALIEVYEVP